MSKLDKISFDELLKGCLSLKLLEDVKVFKHKRTYLIRYVYRHEENPHGQQVVWFLYNPRSIKPVEKHLSLLKKQLEQWAGKIVAIDNFDPRNVPLAVEVSVLGDGKITWDAFTIRIGDIEGYVGVIVGQGRYLDTEDPAVLAGIQMLIANVLGSRLKNPFITDGMKRLKKLSMELQKRGIKVVNKIDKKREKNAAR